MINHPSHLIIERYSFERLSSRCNDHSYPEVVLRRRRWKSIRMKAENCKILNGARGLKEMRDVDLRLCLFHIGVKSVVIQMK